jgi:hypothetical protein
LNKYLIKFINNTLKKGRLKKFMPALEKEKFETNVL